MAVRSTAKAEWHGSLKDGKGDMHLARGGYTGEFTRASRFETGQGTNPEELLAAAHAGCFSMQLSALLSNAGHAPTVIRTTVNVTIEAGIGINKIELSTDVPPAVIEPTSNCAAIRRISSSLGMVHFPSAERHNHLIFPHAWHDDSARH